LPESSLRPQENSILSNFKGQKNAGESIATAVRDTGAAVAEGVKQVKDWVKEKVGAMEPMGFAKVDDNKPGMQVYSSCGCVLGTVDHMENGDIKLRRGDSPDGIHHFISVQWVARVDSTHFLGAASDVRHFRHTPVFFEKWWHFPGCVWEVSEHPQRPGLCGEVSNTSATRGLVGCVGSVGLSDKVQSPASG